VEIDSYATPDAEARLLAAEERLTRRGGNRRELITNYSEAAGFVIAAVSIAVLAPWGQSLSAMNLALVLVTWLVVERVKFPVADGWTHPTMLVFVPALFILPTPIVPVVAVVSTVLRRAPDLVRGRVSRELVPMLIGDAWYTIGPVLVIVLAGAQHFAWSNWPVYVGAFAAYVAFDTAATLTWAWIGEGISPRVQLPLLTWIYVVDAALAPLGLAIAAAAVERPALVLLALSPTAMLWLFARERQQRMNETLALSTAYRGTAMLLGDVVEADHHYTGAHSRDVVDLSLSVAVELGLDAGQRRSVEFAALLHDVGKIHVPKEIINKPGKLDEREWEIMRQHTIDGERMLTQVGGLLANVGHIVRASHEHYAGGGYPDGLAGTAIPIEARIVSTCDAYSAMTTDRSYRKAMPKADALAELRRCSGTQFDPSVVAAILKLESQQLDDRRDWLEQLGSAQAERAALGPEDGPVGDPERLVRVELDRAAHAHPGAERHVPLDNQPLGVA
jgi:HD-GYP domain-containing protein (c-di-GMP phosphodiesterase class II)